MSTTICMGFFQQVVSVFYCTHCWDCLENMTNWVVLLHVFFSDSHLHVKRKMDILLNLYVRSVVHSFYMNVTFKNHYFSFGLKNQQRKKRKRKTTDAFSRHPDSLWQNIVKIFVVSLFSFFLYCCCFFMCYAFIPFVRASFGLFDMRANVCNIISR